MSARSKLSAVADLSRVLTHPLGLTLRLLRHLRRTMEGFRYSQTWSMDPAARILASSAEEASPNPLQAYFDAHREGRGIWKWNHYFEIYDRHFRKFVGHEVRIVEIGIYSGGSLEMWRHYFGPDCRIYGVDIESACKAYENEYTRVFVGDQADRSFWRSFKRDVHGLDIIIDDGGHHADQQIATMEELLPHLRPGGVYLCEDVHGLHNGFAAYARGLADNLNAMDTTGSKPALPPTSFQASIKSMHFYPYVVVIEKASEPLEELIAPKRGTEWQPFDTLGRKA